MDFKSQVLIEYIVAEFKAPNDSQFSQVPEREHDLRLKNRAQLFLIRQSPFQKLLRLIAVSMCNFA